MNRLNAMCCVLAVALMLVISNDAPASGNYACSTTSHLMRAACYAETRDDYLVEIAKCFNESERYEKRECLADVRDAFPESREECRDQFEAREEVCDDIGQAPYDPSFEEEDFETSLGSLSVPNPYFPMQTGNVWVYGGDEEIMVEILDETKLIDDITCFVVRDVVSEDGLLVEDTDDWFAVNRNDGGIWYCGEEVKDFEYFEGDEPMLPELIAIDGSFKVERDGDRAGIIFPGYPQVGDVFRQEYSLGNAEDVGAIVSTNYHYGEDEELDELVPEALAQQLCNYDCVIVAEYTPIEPGAFEYKFYARGIGFFLGINPEDEEVVFLTDCNFSSACDSLPMEED